MNNYEEAVEAVLKHICTLDIEEKPLFESIGQVLAEDVYSEIDLPLTNQSGPDGYAVIADDIRDAGQENPVPLKIIGTVRAGYLPQQPVKRGTAIRIMTGSVVPEGADCIVRFEDTDEPGDKCGPNKNNPSTVRVYKSAVSGAGIAKAGISLKKGAMVVSKGTMIGPAQVSVLITIGKAVVKVIRRPVIAVISTGDELIDLGEPLLPGKTYNCNATAIAALISHYGGIPKVLGIASDNIKSVKAKIKKGMKMDAIITSGGVSKGDFDLVRSVIRNTGKVIFTRVEVGPGASVSFGYIHNQDDQQGKTTIPVFALAGPPVGCLINCEMLVRPSLLKMLGRGDIEHPLVEAVAKDAVPEKRPMTFTRWTKLEKINGEYHVEINRADTLGALTAIAMSNSLTIIPKNTAINKGDRIPVLPLDWQ
jgi:molybdopterin molybdotransferase